MKQIKKIIIDRKGNKNYWREGDFSSLFGKIKKEDIKSGIIKSHINKEFICFDASFIDNITKIKQGPAKMNVKDIGYILSYCGVNENSKIVEAGAGSGVLTAFLGKISKNVYSYENDGNFFKLAKENLDFLNIKVNLKLKDIYSGIDEKDLDLIVLDLLEPWKVIEHADKSLKSGGFLVCYVTNVNQITEFINNLNEFKNSFYLDKVLELIEREWDVNELRIRPKNQGIMHTGFLIFIRKI